MGILRAEASCKCCKNCVKSVHCLIWYLSFIPLPQPTGEKQSWTYRCVSVCLSVCLSVCVSVRLHSTRLLTFALLHSHMRVSQCQRIDAYEWFILRLLSHPSMIYASPRSLFPLICRSTFLTWWTCIMYQFCSNQTSPIANWNRDLQVWATNDQADQSQIPLVGAKQNWARGTWKGSQMAQLQRSLLQWQAKSHWLSCNFVFTRVPALLEVKSFPKWKEKPTKFFTFCHRDQPERERQ